MDIYMVVFKTHLLHTYSPCLVSAALQRWTATVQVQCSKGQWRSHRSVVSTKRSWRNESRDWLFKGKSEPETIDFPIKQKGLSGFNFPNKTNPLNSFKQAPLFLASNRSSYIRQESPWKRHVQGLSKSSTNTWTYLQQYHRCFASNSIL